MNKDQLIKDIDRALNYRDYDEDESQTALRIAIATAEAIKELLASL